MLLDTTPAPLPAPSTNPYPALLTQWLPVARITEFTLQDNGEVNLGPAVQFAKAVFKLYVNYGASAAEFILNANGSAVQIVANKEAAAGIFTTTVNTTDARYMFGILNNNLVIRNTNGANQVFQLFRLA